ncbi:hypothetical protein CLF_110601 [Clonorchis sinensis]|uniref:Uncharacterized protein n=1 Tax=Clonorchis sinensis TaxID=79923 RepID=G7YTP7_CLOSI|nr:hypothetical protein CLF_110601 [Clonorchis sinensis]
MNIGLLSDLYMTSWCSTSSWVNYEKCVILDSLANVNYALYIIFVRSQTAYNTALLCKNVNNTMNTAHRQGHTGHIPSKAANNIRLSMSHNLDLRLFPVEARTHPLKVIRVDKVSSLLVKNASFSKLLSIAVYNISAPKFPDLQLTFTSVTTKHKEVGQQVGRPGAAIQESYALSPASLYCHRSQPKKDGVAQTCFQTNLPNGWQVLPCLRQTMTNLCVAVPQYFQSMAPTADIVRDLSLTVSIGSLLKVCHAAAENTSYSRVSGKMHRIGAFAQVSRAGAFHVVWRFLFTGKCLRLLVRDLRMDLGWRRRPGEGGLVQELTNVHLFVDQVGWKPHLTESTLELMIRVNSLQLRAFPLVKKYAMMIHHVFDAASIRGLSMHELACAGS